MLLGKIAFFVLLVAQIVIRYPYREGMKRTNMDNQEKGLLFGLTVGGLLLPLVYIFTPWLSFADYNPPSWLPILGIIITVAGLYMFWRAHADLGRNWSSSLDIHQAHKLITRGVYQHVRHPMYIASWLMYLGQALFLSNWIAGLGGIIGFALLYFLRVPKEEQMMLNEFGEQYQQYMTKTGRVIPKRGFTSQNP
jgi:protein-S-isoprenylcysteine O-methyltransferase Ste14